MGLTGSLAIAKQSFSRFKVLVHAPESLQARNQLCEGKDGVRLEVILFVSSLLVSALDPVEVQFLKELGDWLLHQDGIVALWL